MALRLACPMRRQRTKNEYLRKRIPRDVLDKVDGLKLTIPIGDGGYAYKTLNERSREIVVSLRTSDPREAKRRQIAGLAYLDGVWEQLRGRAKPLTQKNIVALAGELYHAFADTFEDNPGSPDRWWNVLEADMRANAGQYGRAKLYIGTENERREMALEERFGPAADALLARKGIRTDKASRRRLIDEVSKALSQAWFKLLNNAEGDFRPDPDAQRFPEYEDHRERKRTSGSSITGLLAAWWNEKKAGGASPKTLQSVSGTANKFVEFLGHDDAQKVRTEDVLAFKDARLRSGVSPKTIRDSDLAGLKSIFGWGVSNRRITQNPAKDVTIGVPRSPRLRERGFTEKEAVAILRHASAHQQGKERTGTFDAKRWVPWLMAYSGARVGEIAQLRKQDLLNEDGIWAITITPEAGPVKNRAARKVALHSHLVDLGFPEFVAAKSEGYLFLNVEKRADVDGPLQGLKNRLSEFVREVVDDPRISPNHGWRHRFRTVAIEVGISERIIDAIDGHAPRRVADTYGDVSVRAMANALRTIPRYEADTG